MGLSVTNILGWGGAAALVLAAAHLIKLVIDWGWLTPGRQIGLAVGGATALIGAGVALRKADRRYAGLLPATGIVILFLAVYGAHLHYQLIGPTTAGVAVIAVCFASLALWRLFTDELYVLFAVFGSCSPGVCSAPSWRAAGCCWAAIAPWCCCTPAISKCCPRSGGPGSPCSCCPAWPPMASAGNAGPRPPGPWPPFPC